jgi:hypothetical protein
LCRTNYAIVDVIVKESAPEKFKEENCQGVLDSVIKTKNIKEWMGATAVGDGNLRQGCLILFVVACKLFCFIG